MSDVKSTMAVGIGSMAGMGAIGAVGNLPGMPQSAKSIIPIAGTGMTLLNIGNMARIGTQTLPSMFGTKGKKYKW